MYIYLLTSIDLQSSCSFNSHTLQSLHKLSMIIEVLKTGYEILRNHYSLPNAYLQFFLPTQSREEIKEITEKDWQKLANLVVPINVRILKALA